MAPRHAGVLVCIPLILTACFIPWSGTGSSASNDIGDIQLHMPGEATVHNNDGLMVFIVGFWHELEFTVPEQENIAVMLTNGVDAEAYEWVQNGSGWCDARYGMFIDDERCSRVGQYVTLYISVDTETKTGIWQLKINAGGGVTTEDVELRRNTGGVGFSTPDFYFVVPPYTAGLFDSSNSGQVARFENKGPVPMDVVFTTNDANAYINASAQVLYPYSILEFTLKYNAAPTSPKMIIGEGEALVSYKYIGPSLATMHFTSSYNYPFSFKVFFGSPDLQFVNQTHYSLQYVAGLSIYANQSKTLPLILDGTGVVGLNIYGVNCTVLSIISSGANVTMPSYVGLNNGQLMNFTVTIKATISNGTALLCYVIDGQKYSTIIDVIRGNTSQESNAMEGTPIDWNKIIPLVVLGVLIEGLVVAKMYAAKRTRKQAIKSDTKRSRRSKERRAKCRRHGAF
jgi:hypothetical protein